MNHEQWTKLREATKGHTPGPWVCVMNLGNCSEIPDSRLASYAPDLLAEVERLRAWICAIRYFAHAMEHPRLQAICDSALNGAEVPE